LLNTRWPGKSCLLCFFVPRLTLDRDGAGPMSLCLVRFSAHLALPDQPQGRHLLAQAGTSCSSRSFFAVDLSAKAEPRVLDTQLAMSVSFRCCAAGYALIWKRAARSDMLELQCLQLQSGAISWEHSVRISNPLLDVFGDDAHVVVLSHAAAAEAPSELTVTVLSHLPTTWKKWLFNFA
jgi:hypothetical protein